MFPWKESVMPEKSLRLPKPAVAGPWCRVGKRSWLWGPGTPPSKIAHLTADRAQRRSE